MRVLVTGSSGLAGRAPASHVGLVAGKRHASARRHSSGPVLVRLSTNAVGRVAAVELPLGAFELPSWDDRRPA